MRSFVRIIITCLLIYCLAHAPAYGVSGYTPPQDTTSPNAQKDSAAPVFLLPGKRFKADSLNTERESIYPWSSLQQVLKGNAAGIYIQEPSGEPGSNMSMFIRGTAIPMLSNRSIYEAQPTVILDGIPMIMDDPFAFDIQLYDYNRLGPATNILASIDPDNIASIEVVKDFGKAALYGPRAANGGVILLTTKAPVIGRRRISFNTWIGVAQKPSVYTTNAKFENDFRQPFYDKYANDEQRQTYPLYLRDSTNDAYYGPSNWTDLYFKNRLTYGVNASLSSGTERANFMFAVGNRKTTNPADDARLDRYNAMFEINMVPVRGLTISAMINGTRLERIRNTSLRDRFAEMQYLPDLSNPLPSNKRYYANFRGEYEKSFDENKLNEVNGYFKMDIRFSDKLRFNSSFGFDYNEGLRDLFYPSTLLETVNYVSNYFGYNQRVFFDNSLTFDHHWKDHSITVTAGESFQADYSRYNYAYAYKGPNDLIRVNLLSSADGDGKDRPKSFRRELTFMFLDQQKHRLLAFYGHGTYRYRDLLDLSVLLRADGSSSAQPDNWWFFAPTFSAGVNMKSLWLQDEAAVDQLRFHASWGRVGRLMPDDRFGEGPQYTSDLSFSNNPVRFSYNAFPGMSRAYKSGYIGYGIRWPYTDQLELGLDATFLDNRLNLSFAVYDRVDNNMLLGIPFGAEYGYRFQYKNGMKVRNRGLDAAASYAILPAGNNIQWTIGANVNLNRNKLLALPGGLPELIVADGTKKLYVGRAIDQYWILQNEGIYNRDSDVPVNPNTGKPMTYKGIPLIAGDPKWKDVNGDYVIDDNDKTLIRNSLPIIAGGFNTDVSWRGFTLGMGFYYNWGRKIINQEMATRFDFINHEGVIDMSAVKEITFWSKAGNYEKYPQYNPWSTVIPYRTDQDLFMESGDFLKLRTLSLQYDMTKAPWWKKNGKLYRLTLYGTVSNVFTLTSYTGGDPELVDYNGFDTGYGMPIPRTYTFGLKMDL